MKTFIFLFVLIVVYCTTALSQDYVEVRGGITKDGLTYRYIDYNHTFNNDVVVDIAYYGSPDQNELWVGVGKYKKFSEKTAVTFAVYGVVGKESRQIGLGLSSFGSSEVKKAKVNYQTYGFVPFKGGVKNYLAVDSLDVTFPVKKKVEIGGSVGMYWIARSTNLIAGPQVKFNDKYGSTSFSVRTGAYTEFRISRSFSGKFFK